MNSFTSFFSTPPPPSSLSSEFVVTRDMFNAFHKIDRTLFARLIFSLNRDINQSYQVMGFLLLLEHTSYAKNIVSYLVSLPDTFIDAVANEVGVCLSFLYNQDFSAKFFAANNDENTVIPLLIRLTGGTLSLKLLHQNRETFTRGLTKTMNDVCARAFEDLILRAERYKREKLLAMEREMLIEEMRRLGFQQEPTNSLPVQQETTNSYTVHHETPNSYTVHQETPNSYTVHQETPNNYTVHQETPNSYTVHHDTPNSITFHHDTPNSITVQQEIRVPRPTPLPPVEEETKKEEEEAQMAADDRTVFLTFSKGYPISEEDVRYYFTRRFGDVIEAIEMQDVDEYEQPLFAKMVLKMRCASKMDEIVNVRSRNKYTIDGKHVWARKYIRRNPYYYGASSSIDGKHV